MKVRAIARMPRAHFDGQTRSRRRKDYAALRRYVSELDPQQWKGLDITMTLMLQAIQAAKRQKRFFNKTMHMPSYHRRINRLVAKARRTGGVLLTTSLRGTRVVPRSPLTR